MVQTMAGQAAEVAADAGEVAGAMTEQSPVWAV